MTVPPESIRLPETFASAGDPIDVNPFPVEDTRHEVWRVATRAAEEEVCRFSSKSMSPLASADEDVQRLALINAEFNAWAYRGLHVVVNDAELRHYDEWLLRYANAWLDEISRIYTSNPLPLSVKSQETDIHRNLLAGQVKFWMAEARKYLAEREAYRGQRAGGAAATEPTTTSLQSSELPIPTERRKVEKVGGPRLAAWLKDEMARKIVTENRLHVLTELDRKTIRKMLAGGLVAKVRLSKLARGLSIDISDIPTD